MTTIEISTADDMRALGRLLSAQLRAGDIIVLTGPLGAGKTTLVQGIGEGLAVSGDVTSPTFVVARQHKSGTKGIGLTHVDAYRLNNADDLVDLDIYEDKPHVTVIEWGEPFVQHITDSWLAVTIERDSDIHDGAPESGERKVNLTSHGPLWQGREIVVTS